MRASKAADMKRSRNLVVAGKSVKSLVGAERIELSTKGLRVLLPTHRTQGQYRETRKTTRPPKRASTRPVSAKEPLTPLQIRAGLLHIVAEAREGARADAIAGKVRKLLRAANAVRGDAKRLKTKARR